MVKSAILIVMIVLTTRAYGLETELKAFMDQVEANAPASTFMPAFAKVLDQAMQSDKEHKIAWMRNLENLWAKLPQSYKDSLNIELRKVFYERAFKSTKNIDLCRSLCGLVLRQNEWHRSSFFEKPDGSKGENARDKDSWHYATRSLGLLFLEKAKPYCSQTGEVRKETDELLSKLPYEPIAKPSSPAFDKQTLELLREILTESKGSETSLKSLEDLTSNIQNLSSEKIADTSALYGHQFYGLLMRAQAAGQEGKGPMQSNLDKTDAHHAKILYRSLNRDTDIQGSSFMTTYVFATSVLSMPDPEGAGYRKLKSITDALKNPLELPYHLSSKEAFVPGDRQGAARAVPFYLALYLKAPTKEAKENATSLLKLAVDNYLKHAPSLIMHIQRNGAHVSEDSLAPYYFYPTIPYVATALKVLKARETHAEERAKLESQEKELQAALLTLLEKGGLFAPMGENITNIQLEEDALEPVGVLVANPAPKMQLKSEYFNPYESSASYVNPLAGLALLPLIEKCDGKSVSPSMGIIDLSLESRTSGDVLSERKPHHSK